MKFLISFAKNTFNHSTLQYSIKVKVLDQTMFISIHNIAHRLQVILIEYEIGFGKHVYMND